MSGSSGTTSTEHRRIAIVASELLGRPGTGGAGTADSLLAVALARHGHPVDLIVASGRDIGELNPEWTHIYESAGVNVRVLERVREVTPPYLARAYEVYGALRDVESDVAIVNDWRGLGWAALRARDAGLDFNETAFVVHCHGPGRVLTEFAQKVPDTLDRFGEDVMERASFALADAVVSPSEWLLGWLRAHRWPVPDSAKVVQYIRRSTALDETPQRATTDRPIRRLAFFGQLREGKGIRIYLAALNAFAPELLTDSELLFLGGESKRWPQDRIVASLPPAVQASARVETALTREAALDELLRPGTLAVMPSLLDNSPNTVWECIEHGIPFISTDTGGIAELVAEEDRARVLCRPTPNDLAAALERALRAPAFEPAQPAREPDESLRAWLELVREIEPRRPRQGRPPLLVAVAASGDASGERARRLAGNTKAVEVDVVHGLTRRAALAHTAAEWILFLDDEDEPDDELLDALVSAQAATGADAVTVAVRPSHDPDAVHLFLGDPRALGLVENQYGVIGLVRASLAVAELGDNDGTDPDWPLFARLAVAGAHVVSIPKALSRHSGRPGKVADVPGEGLAVLETFERAGGGVLEDLPQLAATLGASLERPTSDQPATLAEADGEAFLIKTRRRLKQALR